MKSIRFRIFRNRFVSSYLGVVRLLSIFTIRIQWKETFIRIFFQHISSVVSIVKARHTYKLSLHAPPITPPLALPCLLFPLVFALEFADSIELYNKKDDGAHIIHNFQTNNFQHTQKPTQITSSAGKFIGKSFKLVVYVWKDSMAAFAIIK